MNLPPIHPLISIFTCSLHDDPSSRVTFWRAAATSAAATAAAGSGSTGRQHGLAVSHRSGDGPRHRPQDHGDLPAPQKHAGMVTFVALEPM